MTVVSNKKRYVPATDDPELIKKEKEKGVTLHSDKFETIKAKKVLRKESFQIQYGSSVLKIFGQDGVTYNFTDLDSVKGKGFHICKKVKQDVEDFIEDNPDYDYSKYIDKDEDISMVDVDALKAHVGNAIYSVDINDCYWDTLYKRHFITQKTYLDGLKKCEEWKAGRNASIGALNKSEYIATFINGEKVSDIPMDKNAKMTGIRSEIVGSVNEMFEQLREQVQGKWLMYFTDCVYVKDLDTVKECIAFFDKRKYQVKMETYHLDSVTDNQIFWHDFKNNKTKSFMYLSIPSEIPKDGSGALPIIKPMSPNKNF